jgi:2-oxo-4-hydroxy-4-carboxy-5-ureidoimidazoline decarboxylase
VAVALTNGSTTAVTVFNALSAEDAAQRLAGCLHASGWVASMLAGRPYPDRAGLLAEAYRSGAALTDDDLATALARHPRIGERPSGGGRDAAHSRTEQGGVDAADAQLAAELHAGNVAYEAKFGQVFLIRAAGRSGPQILAALTERLAHDPQTEAVVVREQLAEIAQLRLGVLLDELEAAS